MLVQVLVLLAAPTTPSWKQQLHCAWQDLPCPVRQAWCLPQQGGQPLGPVLACATATAPPSPPIAAELLGCMALQERDEERP